MMENFIIYIQENLDDAENIYNEYYNEKATEEGLDMQGDERYYGDDGYDMEPSDVYEDFAHCTGHSANYHGAWGVITELGRDFNIDPDDEEIQWEVLMILEKEPK